MTTPTAGSDAAENPAAPAGFYQALVSHYDGADFDGDWRYSAFCPDIDVAMDGRSTAEALSLLQHAVRIKRANGAGAQPVFPSPAERAEAVADFLTDGRLIERTAIRVDPA